MTLKNKQKTTINVLAGLAVLLTLISADTGIMNAYAVTCSTSSGLHCYAREEKNVSNYGAQATYTITSLSLPSGACSNSDFSDVEQWVNFLSGGWVEVGYTVGKLNGGCVSNGSPVTFHAYSLSGSYQEFNDGSITVGSQPVYTVDDVARDGSWVFSKNGASLTPTVVGPISGSSNWIGAETTTNGATIPTSDINLIAYDSGSFQYWTSNSGQKIDMPPMWLIHCTPAYKHIRVGTGTFGSC